MARVSIEDCLHEVDNRFILVLVASQRTRQLMGGSDPLVRVKNKEAVTALREIAEGHIIAKVPDPVPEEDLEASAEGDAATDEVQEAAPTPDEAPAAEETPPADA